MLRKLLLRELTSVLLILLTPCAVLAADTDAAVLYGTGSVYLNGSQLANSSPVTSGDVIQTRATGWRLIAEAFRWPPAKAWRSLPGISRSLRLPATGPSFMSRAPVE